MCMSFHSRLMTHSQCLDTFCSVHAGKGPSLLQLQQVLSRWRKWTANQQEDVWKWNIVWKVLDKKILSRPIEPNRLRWRRASEVSGSRSLPVVCYEVPQSLAARRQLPWQTIWSEGCRTCEKEMGITDQDDNKGTILITHMNMLNDAGQDENTHTYCTCACTQTCSRYSNSTSC